MLRFKLTSHDHAPYLHNAFTCSCKSVYFIQTNLMKIYVTPDTTEIFRIAVKIRSEHEIFWQYRNILCKTWMYITCTISQKKIYKYRYIYFYLLQNNTFKLISMK